jgi:pimeloyl-ACP methyl ester carboxylesterase
MVVPEEIPVTVLSANDATDEELTEREGWVRHSVRGRHVRLHDCGHWIQIRRPDAVVDAARDLVELANS